MREQIIEKSSELFVKIGFNIITMDDLADELNISKRTLYKFFTNKKSLVQEAAVFLEEKFHSKLLSVKSLNCNAVKEHFEIQKVFNSLVEIIGVLQLNQLKKKYPDIHKCMTSIDHQTFNSFMKDNFAKGITEGYFRSDLNQDRCIEFYYKMRLSIIENTSYLKHKAKEMELSALIYHLNSVTTERGKEELTKCVKNFI